MKELKHYLAAVGVAAAAVGCSTVSEVEERDAYAQPNWYVDCAESGAEGRFWWREEYVYACGLGESRFVQAAEEEMYAIALNNFARRMSGTVDSRTSVYFEDGAKSSTSSITYSVDTTLIREHVTEEKATFRHGGSFHTFVRLKMARSTFENLMEEASNERRRGRNG
ncbi:hypothetical protein GJ672_03765 [Spiribacter sp. 2438]|uniref:hypothetical protein n=1 Tax=Spiribacter sp. 2438 TaxID=2666185 RepID=UPI0012B0B73F|nr:hypothetical protein [Spiribacter sp. 2438]QGM21471.1 hypothetical protein GJ672_03765 [Spiribacter sp. 2438]